MNKNLFATFHTKIKKNKKLFQRDSQSIKVRLASTSAVTQR